MKPMATNNKFLSSIDDDTVLSVVNKNLSKLLVDNKEQNNTQLHNIHSVFILRR